MSGFGPWQDGMQADSGGYNFDLNFGSGNGYATDGQIGPSLRANDSFLGFDQSKISSSIYDVMSSLGSTALNSVGKAAGKALGDAIAPPKAGQQNLLSNFFQSFSSTKTGQQVQNAAIMGNIQGFFMSPIVWFVAVAGLIAFVVVARR